MSIATGYFDVKETLKEITKYFLFFGISKNSKIGKQNIER
jgi:hypothetical protein